VFDVASDPPHSSSNFFNDEEAEERQSEGVLQAPLQTNQQENVAVEVGVGFKVDDTDN